MSDMTLDDTEVQTPRIRADLLTPDVQVVPGEPVFVSVQVLNSTPVIETIRVGLVGLMAESVVQLPEEVTLFPDEATLITVELRFHATLPSGFHEGLVVVEGESGQYLPSELPLRVRVPESPAARLSVEPPLRIGGKKGTFDITVDNDGNTPLNLLVRATDANRQLKLYVSNPSLRLRVDQSGIASLVAVGKRPLTGSPIEHLITVTADRGELTETAEVTFRQKPRLTPGIITIMVLSLIVALWALAMLFGVRTALAPAPPMKALPATFAAGEGVGMEDLDPVAVGGTITGMVSASSTGQPLPRVTVEAFDTRGQLVTATATGDDGTYELAGLLPRQYQLRMRAEGYQEQWWPGGGPTPIAVPASGAAEDIDLTLVGLPGALGGQAIAGDGEVAEIRVEVVAIDLAGGESAPTATVADANGLWSVSGLTTPATYRITYRSDGYAPVEMTQPVGGGEQVVVNPSRLPAAPGGISGTVVDRDGVPLGGVEVTAQRGEFVLATMTPTTGEVGAFDLPELETPGTYLLTFSLDGYAAETRAVRLNPGESREGMQVELGAATGAVMGRVSTTDGRDLGGVRVTVSGGGTVLTTDTFTSGDIGSFRLAGLPVPGIYTVTFDLEGYARQTVQVQLDRSNPQVFAEAWMSASVGRITGRVIDDGTGQPIGATTISISDGETVRETTTASAPAGQIGRFNVGDLPPGTYTVTATTPDGRTITLLQSVQASQTEDVTLRVPASGSSVAVEESP
jgi:hypothetical protein